MFPKTRYIPRNHLEVHRHRRHVTQSGLTLVELCQPHLHRGAVSVFFKAGSRFETKQRNGISHFLEHMVFRGTEGYPTTYAQNLAVEKLGGILFAATAPDATEFAITLPMETLEEGTRLLAAILTKPLFREIEIERRIIAEEVLEDLDEAGNSIDIDFLSRARLWPDHPLGQAIAGPLANIQSFTVDDVFEHFRRTYVAENTVVCLTGAFDTDRIPKTVAEHFSAIPSGEVTPLTLAPTPAPGPTIQHARKPGSQTQLRLAFHAPGEDSKASVPLSILLAILDDGMSTRLHRRIFDERGLAYNVGADLDAYQDVSAFNIDVTASHKNVAEVVRELLRLVMELKREPVTAAELKKAKQRSAWSLDDFLDDPHGMAAWYGEQALFRPPPTLSSRREAILAVTERDIKRVARSIFTQNKLHITTVGAITQKTKQDIHTAVEGFQ